MAYRNNILEPNTSTSPFTDYYFNKSQDLNLSGNNTSNFFKTIVSFGFEPANSFNNCGFAYNVFPLFDNNYFAVVLNKLSINYRLFSANGVFLNKPMWDFAFDPCRTMLSDTENNDSILETRVINVNKITELHSFLIQLKNKDIEEMEITGMKDLFLKVDELIDNNDFLSLDDFIISFISLEFSFQFHISLLASTLKVKNILKKRNIAFQNAIKLGEQIMSTEEVLLTLQGLE